MKIQYALIFIFCFCAHALSSQGFHNKKQSFKSGFKISGKVLDVSTREPVMFASVALYSKEGVLLAGAETNIEGEYCIHNVQKGEYILEPSFIGYFPKRIIGHIVKRNIISLDLDIEERVTFEHVVMSCSKGLKPKAVETPKRIPKTLDTLFTLSGQVLDEATNEPVMFASVALFNSKGALVKGVETDLEGKFTIHNVKKGAYSIEPSFIGYEPMRITGNVNKDVLYLNIKIRESQLPLVGLFCPSFAKPLIRQDETTSGRIITAEDIRPTYSLHYRRPSKSKDKKKKKERKKNKENKEDHTTTPIAEVVNHDLTVDKKRIEIRLFPNPSAGQVYIDTSTEIQKVDVLNMEGKLILSVLSIQEKGLELSKLPAGTYYLQFYHQEGVQVEKLILVNSL